MSNNSDVLSALKTSKGILVICGIFLSSIGTIAGVFTFFKPQIIHGLGLDVLEQRISTIEHSSNNFQSEIEKIKNIQNTNCMIIRSLQNTILLKNKDISYLRLIFQEQKKSPLEIRTTEQLAQEELIRIADDIKKLSNTNNC
jgi:hypothetical protein